MQKKYSAAQLCRFLPQNWPASVRKHALKFKTVQVDENFYQFLEEDGIYIHPDYYKSQQDQKKKEEPKKDSTVQQTPQIQSSTKKEHDKEEINYPQKIEGDEEIKQDEDLPQFRQFPYIAEQINAVLEEYSDSGVFLKLNWRAPLDQYANFPDLKFYNLSDILLVLKSSGIFCEMLEDYQHVILFQQQKKEKQKAIEEKASFPNQNQSSETVQQVVTGYQQGSNPPPLNLSIVLRKWYNLKPQNEFRCFVMQRKLVAISQRRIEHCFEELLSPEKREQTIQNLLKFYNDVLAIECTEKHFMSPAVIDAGEALQDYVFDVYIDQVAQPNRVWLVDINPWREFTNSLLFTFDELEANDYTTQKSVILKLVEQPSDTVFQDYSAYRVPEELAEDSSPEKIIQMMEAMAESEITSQKKDQQK